LQAILFNEICDTVDLAPNGNLLNVGSSRFYQAETDIVSNFAPGPERIFVRVPMS
jgi:hypothetical protein